MIKSDVVVDFTPRPTTNVIIAAGKIVKIGINDNNIKRNFLIIAA